jgi:hypothetical protein
VTNTQLEFQELAERLDKLEVQNRRWKLAAILLAVSSTSLVLIAAKPADQIDPNVIHARTVEARDFVLKDEDGQIRARLTLNPKRASKGAIILDSDIKPALQFYDDRGDAYWSVPQGPSMIPTR